MVMKIATSEITAHAIKPEDKGKARAASLSKKRPKAIARRVVEQRWKRNEWNREYFSLVRSVILAEGRSAVQRIETAGAVP